MKPQIDGLISTIEESPGHLRVIRECPRCTAGPMVPVSVGRMCPICGVWVARDARVAKPPAARVACAVAGCGHRVYSTRTVPEQEGKPLCWKHRRLIYDYERSQKRLLPPLTEVAGVLVETPDRRRA
jgi:hypothetical protein